jgi:hypothetical protein
MPCVTLQWATKAREEIKVQNEPENKHKISSHHPLAGLS